MNRRAVLQIVLPVLIVLGVVAGLIAPNIGVQHATPAEEKAVLRKLRHATARQTLDALFWAVNHHSGPVKTACLDAEYRPASWFDEARRWEISSIRPAPDQKPGRLSSQECQVFIVRFRHLERFDRMGRCGNLQNGDRVEFSFTLERDSTKSPWKVTNYGMG